MVRTLLKTAFLLALAGCNSHYNTGSAEGYGGGDNDIAAVENARLAVVATLRKIRDGELVDPVCNVSICIGANCSAIRSLSPEQRQYMARALTDRSYSDALLGVLENASAIKVSDAALILDGKQVDAVTELGLEKIVLSRSRVSEQDQARLIALLVHEAMHAVAFPFDSDGLLSDDEEISEGGTALFSSGRQLANLTGGCVQVHEERERIMSGISLPPSGRTLSDLQSALPTTLPTVLPTALPTSLPTVLPSAVPAAVPTPAPASDAPVPTAAPVAKPTPLPTNLPPAPANLPPLPTVPNLGAMPQPSLFPTPPPFLLPRR